MKSTLLKIYEDLSPRKYASFSVPSWFSALISAHHLSLVDNYPHDALVEKQTFDFS